MSRSYWQSSRSRESLPCMQDYGFVFCLMIIKLCTIIGQDDVTSYIQCQGHTLAKFKVKGNSVPCRQDCGFVFSLMVIYLCTIIGQRVSPIMYDKVINKAQGQKEAFVNFHLVVRIVLIRTFV